MRVIMLTLVVILCVGCTCVDMKGYVAADKATFIAITPEYLEYVENDSALDQAKKDRRRRLVATWKLRINNTVEAGDTP